MIERWEENWVNREMGRKRGQKRDGKEKRIKERWEGIEDKREKRRRNVD